MEPTIDDRIAAVIAAEHRWAAAHRRLDLEAIDALMDEGYVRVRSDGSLGDKRTVLDWYADRHSTWEIAEADDLVVRIFEDTAVVTGRWRGRGTGEDGAFDYAARYTAVWADRAGHWQMVTEQSTPIRTDDTTVEATMHGGIDAIGMVVRDMEATVRFYRTLGLEFPDGAEAEDHSEVVLPGGTRLMLDTEEMVAGFDPTWVSPTGRGRVGLAYRCADPAAVDRLFAELRAAGYAAHAEPWDAFWGQRYAGIIDPDGTVIDLYAPLD